VAPSIINANFKKCGVPYQQQKEIVLLALVLGIDIESPKIDCLSFVYVPATSAAHNRLLFCFFAVAVFSTNEENTCH